MCRLEILKCSYKNGWKRVLTLCYVDGNVPYARVLIIIFVFKILVTILIVVAKITVLKTPTLKCASLGVNREVPQGFHGSASPMVG